MAATIPSDEPARLRAGDTWKWTRTLGDYPAGTWTLKYRFKNAAGGDVPCRFAVDVIVLPLLAPSILAGLLLAFTPCVFPMIPILSGIIVGHGHATKDQVQQMMRLLLDLDDIPRPDDAADALAIALCHFQSARFHTAFPESSSPI